MVRLRRKVHVRGPPPQQDVVAPDVAGHGPDKPERRLAALVHYWVGERGLKKGLYLRVEPVRRHRGRPQMGYVPTGRPVLG